MACTCFFSYSFYVCFLVIESHRLFLSVNFVEPKTAFFLSVMMSPSTLFFLQFLKIKPLVFASSVYFHSLGRGKRKKWRRRRWPWVVQVLAKVNMSLESLIFSRPSTIHLWYVYLKYVWICFLNFFSCSSMIWLDFSKCDFPAFFLLYLMRSRFVFISFRIWMFVCFPSSYLISSGLVLFNVFFFFVCFYHVFFVVMLF